MLTLVYQVQQVFSHDSKEHCVSQKYTKLLKNAFSIFIHFAVASKNCTLLKKTKIYADMRLDLQLLCNAKVTQNSGQTCWETSSQKKSKIRKDVIHFSCMRKRAENFFLSVCVMLPCVFAV